MFGLVFWGYFLRSGKVLLPADLLVGAYYPWRENKWGYEVAVPYKNPLLSDSYSQLFVWKKLMADSYKAGQWPLWNPTSYSGYPLAANIQSAVFYLANILFLWLPFNTAWNFYLILGSVLSSLSMYFLIRTLGMSKGAGVVGGIAYGYCGYAISWMEFATATNSMIWISTLILIVEKYYQNKNKKIWWWLAPTVFMLITSGSFQMSFYGLVVFGAFSVFRKSIRVETILYGILGVLLASIALLPGIEMMTLSVRNAEGVMKGINYGLVPIWQILTVVAPDFFGNPATGNYWGYSNYHETLIYGGMVMFAAVLLAVIKFKVLPREIRFFVIMIGISLLFFIDNPIAVFIYGLNIPGISTFSAGRTAFFWCLGGAVLIGYLVDNLGKENWMFKVKMWSGWIGLMLILALSVFGLRNNLPNYQIALRNLVIPIGLLFVIGIGVLFSKYKWWWLILVGAIAIDSGKFVQKYLPISDSKYVFPKTEVTDYMQKDKDIFRVEKENGSLLSPNTWAMYGLQSPSGYDPVALKSYTEKFNRDLNGSNSLSRYAEITKYDAKALGNYNVKYLLAIKKDKEDRIPGDKISYKIKADDWEKVYETQVVAVLKNKYFQERARLVGGLGKVNIVDYQNNSLKMKYETDKNADLVLMDTWYPGWKAWVNGIEVKIEKYDEVFRKVKVEAGSGIVEMKYQPASFYWGKWISLITFIFFLTLGLGNWVSKTKLKWF